MSKRKKEKIKAQELARLGNWHDAFDRAAPVERPWERVPYTPYVPISETSKAAAQALKEDRTKVANYREQVYKCIALHGPCTDEEIAERTGINPSTARPRRVDLMRSGRVRASDVTIATRSGRQAQAWTVTTPDDF